MKLDITGLNIEVTEAMKNYVEKKTEKLAKFFEEGTLCHVTFKIEKEAKNVDIRIEFKSHTYLAEESSEDLYANIDEAIEKIEGQIRKTKTIEEKKRRS